jgi:hypothetical protein
MPAGMQPFTKGLSERFEWITSYKSIWGIGLPIKKYLNMGLLFYK